MTDHPIDHDSGDPTARSVLLGSLRESGAVDLRSLRHAIPSPEPLIHHPDLLTRRYRVTVIGDIRIDIRGLLHGGRFVDFDTDHQESGSIVTDVGGTAMNFADVATTHFESVHVIGALGRDGWTDFIRSRCLADGIEACLTEVPTPNSPVVVLRDGPCPEQPDGVRLILADSDSPYAYLDAAQVRRCAEFIQAADALVVDGYAMLREGSAEGLHAATEIAAAAGVPIAFDIVPHHIDEYVDLDELVPILRRCSMITVEAPTLLRLLRRDVPAVITPELVHELVTGLPDELGGPQRTWFVRYGHGMMDETSAVSARHHHCYYRTGYAQAAEVAGYGYVAAAAELKWWLTNFATASTAYPTLAGRVDLVDAHRFQPHEER